MARKTELRFLRFIAKGRTDATGDDELHLGSLLINLETEFTEVYGAGLAVACADAELQLQNSLFTSILCIPAKIEPLNPENFEDLNRFSECSELCHSQLNELEKADLSETLGRDVESLEVKLRSSRCFAHLFAKQSTKQEKVRDLSTQREHLAFAAGDRSYISWICQVDQSMQKEAILDLGVWLLLQKVCLTAHKATEIYLAVLKQDLGVLKGSEPSGSGNSLTVIDFLLAMYKQFLKVKLVLVKAEVSIIYFQVAETSLFDFPEIDGLGFIDPPFGGSPRELLIYEADWIACLKYQIELVLRELELSLLRAIGEQHNQHQELKGLAAGVNILPHRTEYYSFLVVDDFLWFYVLWLFDFIKLLKAQKGWTWQKIIPMLYSHCWHDWTRKDNTDK